MRRFDLVVSLAALPLAALLFSRAAFGAGACCVPGTIGGCLPDIPICPPGPRLCFDPKAECTTPIQTVGCEALVSELQRAMAADLLCTAPPRIVETATKAPTWTILGEGKKADLRKLRAWVFAVSGVGGPAYCPAVQSTGQSQLVLKSYTDRAASEADKP